MYHDFHSHALPVTPGTAVLVSAASPVTGGAGVFWSCQAHPWEAELPEDWDRLARRADAVGEAGLDRRKGIAWEAQLARFGHAAALAAELGKPLVLHEVRAFDECRRILARHPGLRVLRHGWNTPDTGRLEAALKLGWYIGVGAKTPAEALGYFREQPRRRGSLALESDDDPASLPGVYARTAAALGIAPEELEQLQRDNFNAFLKG